MRCVRLVLPLALLAAAPSWGQIQTPPRAPQPAQATGQLDSSEALFDVLAAVNAAGYDDEIDAASNHPLRAALGQYLAARNLNSVAPLKRFVRDHRPKDPGADLSQYISFALAVEGPPDFRYRYPTSALPPDVAALYEFTPLLIEFYKEAHLDELWKRSQP